MIFALILTFGSLSAHKGRFSFTSLLDIISVIGIYRILNKDILSLNTNFSVPQTFLNIFSPRFFVKYFTLRTLQNTAPTNIPTIIVGINIF